MRIVLILFFLLGSFNELSAQQQLPEHMQQKAENLANASGLESVPDNGYLQDLSYYERHPLNINTVTADQLRNLRVLNELQLSNFITYRRVMGDLISIYELQSIPGWDINIINQILPYITIYKTLLIKSSLKEIWKGDQELSLKWSRDIERSRGYILDSGNHYLGDPNHLTFQYNYRVKDLLQFGISGDKDAGEQFFKGAQSSGFDFYSFYLFIKGTGILKSVAIGDFSVSLGQGLIRWQSMAYGKGSDISGTVRQSSVLSPSSSTTEFNYNRGVGLTVQKGKFESTAFFSVKNLTANALIDSISFFSSLITSGLHRTAVENSNRNSVQLISMGGNLKFIKDNLKIGINVIREHFSIPFQKKPAPYNYFAFSGTELFNGSIDYSYFYKNLYLFGEIATDRLSNCAIVNGALISINKYIDISIYYRNIKQYTSLFSNTFSASGSSVNETGMYSGISLKLKKELSISAYFDLYSYPWLRYRINSPASGSDYKIVLDYTLSATSKFSAQFRNETKPLNNDTILPIYYPVPQIYKNLEFQWISQMNKKVIMKCKAVYLHLQGNVKESAISFYVQTDLHFIKKFTSSIRLQYFNTASYNSRIYIYESSNISGFNTPAVYNKGYKYFLEVNYKFSKNIRTNLQWSQVTFPGLKSIGSGLDLIRGNHKSQILSTAVMNF